MTRKASEEVARRVLKNIGEIKMGVSSGNVRWPTSDRKTHREARRDSYDLRVSYTPWDKERLWYEVKLIAYGPIYIYSARGRDWERKDEIGRSSIQRSLRPDQEPITTLRRDIERRFEDLEVDDVWEPIKSRRGKK